LAIIFKNIRLFLSEVEGLKTCLEFGTMSFEDLWIVKALRTGTRDDPSMGRKGPRRKSRYSRSQKCPEEEL